MSSGRAGDVVRALSFGSVADQYERYRLDYPEALVDVVQEYAGRPLRRALEIGAGTGKATRLFASRGRHVSALEVSALEVTALEPDVEMANVLAVTTRGLPVAPVVATLEQFATADRFDLVYAAASWHWTDPATRWSRAVELLVPGGVLALFGSPADLVDPVLSAAVDAIERQLLPVDDPAGHRWSIEDMAAVDGLTEVVRRDLTRLTTLPAAEFVGRLATVSAYLMLDPEARAAALGRVAAVLPDRVDVDATVHLALARRA